MGRMVDKGAAGAFLSWWQSKIRSGLATVLLIAAHFSNDYGAQFTQKPFHPSFSKLILHPQSGQILYAPSTYSSSSVSNRG